jgi:hypothetical protein
MAEALRGSKLGATSYENELGVDLAPRLTVTYHCPRGHEFDIPLAVGAQVPATWDCRNCGATAVLKDAADVEARSGRTGRTPWEMLLERRTMDDLQILLDERLAVLRGAGGATVATHPTYLQAKEQNPRRRRGAAPITAVPERKSA